MFQVESDEFLKPSVITPVRLTISATPSLEELFAWLGINISEARYSVEGDIKYLGRQRDLLRTIEISDRKTSQMIKSSEAIELHFFSLGGLGYIQAGTLIERGGFQLGTLRQALFFLDTPSSCQFEQGCLIPLGSANLPNTEAELFTVGEERSLPEVVKPYGYPPHVVLTHPHSYSKYRSNLFLGYRKV